MAPAINLNADMGESTDGADIARDLALLDHVTSASIACGFHAGDPEVMHRVVAAAAARGVSIGAHPGFHDREGFGRREIRMSPAGIEHMVAYQIGALDGIARLTASTITHVKPHGALYNMAAADSGYAMAIARAIHALDRALIFIVPPGSAMERAGRDLGLAIAREGFPDRAYDDNGHLVPRGVPGAVIENPAAIAERALRMACDGEIVAASGKRLKLAVDTLCIHGDEPCAVDNARAVRAALDASAWTTVSLPTLLR